MDWILSLGVALTGSQGLAIILLSIVVFICITPLRKFAARMQQEETAIQNKLAAPIREAKAKYKGEAQFNEIERIYKEFNYHPIKSTRSALGLVVQIPFLLSALLLLLHHPEMQGTPFLFIHDLGASDGLIRLPLGGPVNVLPVVMLGLSVIESLMAAEGRLSMALRDNMIGVVIFVIVYPLASALVLYWTCNNVWSLLSAIIRTRAKRIAGGAR